MILFDLKCARKHVFEAWFLDGAAYEAQRAAGEIACPACGDADVSKAPMAPRVHKGKGRDGGESNSAKDLHEALHELRRYVEKNSDHVGDRFPEEARKIHYGEVDKRNIHGEASEREAGELADEGISFSRRPWPSRQNS